MAVVNRWPHFQAPPSYSGLRALNALVFLLRCQVLQLETLDLGADVGCQIGDLGCHCPPPAGGVREPGSPQVKANNAEMFAGAKSLAGTPPSIWNAMSAGDDPSILSRRLSMSQYAQPMAYHQPTTP